MNKKTSPAAYVTRYVVTYQKPGELRRMCGPAQGRCTYPTRKGAEKYLRDMLANNLPRVLREFYHCEPSALEVRPVACYPGHFDPVSVYFHDTEEPTPPAPISKVAKAVELLERYTPEFQAGGRGGGTMGGVSLAMDAAREALRDVDAMAQALARLIAQAEKGLDQSATRDGLTNAEAIANARAALSTVRP